MTRAAYCFLALAIAAGCTSAASNKSSTPPTDKPDVTSEDLERGRSEPIEVILQRKVPGLIVVRTPNGVSLQIRGSSTLSGSSRPLYVLDGIPVEPGPQGVLTGVNPHDIDTIKVLKGADAAIYGINGGNGVIVVTTKKK